MKIVQFLKHHDLWNSGEQAGFEDAEAERLVAKKIAIWPPKKDEAKADAKVDKPEAKTEAKPDPKPDVDPKKKDGPPPKKDETRAAQ